MSSINDKLNNLVQAFKHNFEIYLSLISGTPISFKKLEPEDLEEFNSIIKKTFVYFQKIEEICLLKMSEKKKARKALQFLNQLGQEAFPEIPKNKDYLEWSLEESEKKLDETPKWTYMNETTYFNYIDLLEEIIIEAFENYIIYESFFESFINGLDFLLTLQSSVSRLDPNYNYLKKKRKRFTLKHVKNLVCIYRDFSGQYERQIALVYGFVKIPNTDREINYSKIMKKPLFDKLEYLKSTEKVIPLISPFKKIIRNSIAHDSVIYNPLNKTVFFRDLKKIEKYSWQDFEKEVKEFSTLVFALSKIFTITNRVMYETFLEFVQK